MVNGLYNGLDNGLQKGEFNGQRNGLLNGMFENETVIKKEVIQQGLQLYLDFSNPRCYNYGQGEIGNPVYNLIKGGGKNLSVQNLTGRAAANAPYVDYVPIAHWNNYNLNGINQSYLTSPNNTDFDLGLNGLTIQMWVKNVATNGSYSIYSNKALAGSVTGRWGFVFKDTLALGFYFQSSSGFNDMISTNNVLVLNKWQYITVVLNRTTGVKLYVDNVEVGSLNINTSGENLTVNRPFHIGLHSDNLVASGARFEMNYYTHYNRALSIDELTYNYNTTKQFMKV